MQQGKEKPNTLRSRRTGRPVHVTAVWRGYSQPYVKSIIAGGLKVLKLLGTLTFDPALLMWTKGLEGHLKSMMEKSRKEVEKEKSYIF